MSFDSDYDSEYEYEYESEYDGDVSCDEDDFIYQADVEDISEEYIYFSSPIRCVGCNKTTSDPFHSCTNIPLTLKRKIEIIETNVNSNKHDLFKNSEPMNIPPHLKIDGSNFIKKKLLLCV